MNYPDNIEEKLGFDRIRQMVVEACLNPLAHRLVLKAKFTANADNLSRWLLQVFELKTILEEGGGFPFGDYDDVGAAIEKLRVEGRKLSLEEFYNIRRLSEVIINTTEFIKTREEESKELFALLEKVEPQPQIITLINKVITETGEFRDDASSELKSISSKIRVAEATVTRTLNSLFKKSRAEGWAAETDVSVKEGRYVLPILAEHKRKLNGIVHDSSGGGKVLYIEPIEVVEVSNSLRELQLERDREIEKILSELSHKIRVYRDDIDSYQQKAVVLDYVQAKAKVALRINATLPHLDIDKPYKLSVAKHPLLYLTLKKEDKEVTPLNLELDEQNRVLVISGPNAGGKSVTLKTVGLLQYMLQCGYLVPVDEGSNFKLFKQVLVDIGDDQSIDNNLSTYSSHLSSMKYFVEKANKNTLFLIDELGNGTDPQFGGPIGESILRELLKRGGYGIVTTHFSNLKLLANNAPGVLNGAMAYDVKQLKPLFRLDVGKPGSSFAFEVAQNIGLSKKVLDQAKKITGTKQKQIDVLLAELEQDKEEITKLRNNIEGKDKHLSKLIEDYEEIKEALEQNKKGILKKANEEALAIIQSANKQIEQTIKEIRLGKAQKENTKKIRQQLETTKEELTTKTKALKVKSAVVKPYPNLKLAVGVIAAVKDKNMQGEVLELGKRDAVLLVGSLRTIVRVRDLVPVGKPHKQQQEPTRSSKIMNRDEGAVANELDVRGKRGDEAVNEVLDFLDRARLYGWNKLRIIHGRGDGILKRLIRQQLKLYDFIATIADEHVDFGGDGVTVVEFKD